MPYIKHRLLATVNVISGVIVILTTSCSAQSLSSEQLTRLTLPDGFLLKYIAITHDLRSPLQVQQDLQNQKLSFDMAVKAKAMTQDQADQRLQSLTKAERAPQKSAQEEITLSVRDGVLLCVSQTNEHHWVALYDGKKSYIMETAKGMSIGAGWDSRFLMRLPSPAVSLPYMPLARVSALAPSNSTGSASLEALLPGTMMRDGSLIYLPADIQTFPGNGPPRIQKITIKRPPGNDPMVTIEYQQFQKLKGLPIASQFRKTDFDRADPSDLNAVAVPLVVTDYRLVKVSDPPLAARYYDIQAYLKEGDPVVDRQDTPVVSYEYHPLVGDFIQQRKRQILQERLERESVNHGYIQKRGKSGLVAVFVLVFCTLIMIFMRKRI